MGGPILGCAKTNGPSDWPQARIKVINPFAGGSKKGVSQPQPKVFFVVLGGYDIQ
jgi:hypothetical protein